MDKNKELEDFAVRLAGAFTGAAEAAAFELYFHAHPEMTEKFPFNTIAPGFPPNDNFIVGGLAIPPWVIGLLVEGDADKKGDTKTREFAKAVKKFGEGDMCYSWAMVVHHTAVRNIAKTWPPQSQVPSPGASSAGRPPAAVVTKF